MRHWLRTAMRRDVVRRALTMAAIVGPVLLLINHGDVLFGADVDGARAAKMLLTVFVPYVVSTWSSVGAVRASLAS